MNRNEILDGLTKLLPAQFEQLLFVCAPPQGIVPGAETAQATRAIALIRLMENNSRTNELVAALRRLRSGDGGVGGAAGSRLKILFFSASPEGASATRIEEEARDIERRLRAGTLRDNFELKIALAMTPDDLSQRILQERPGIVHFSGHGATVSRGIVLQDEARRPVVVAPATLARLFKAVASRGVRGVVLNACYSVEQSSAIAEHVDFVVGMTDKIPLDPAIKFSTGFYGSMVEGVSLQEAFDLGCVQIALSGLADDDQPRLMMRSGVDPKTLILG